MLGQIGIDSSNTTQSLKEAAGTGQSLRVQERLERVTLRRCVARLTVAWLTVAWASIARLRLSIGATIALLGWVALASILLPWHAKGEAID